MRVTRLFIKHLTHMGDLNESTLAFDKQCKYSFKLEDYNVSIENNIFTFERKHKLGDIYTEWIYIKICPDKIYHVAVVYDYIGSSPDPDELQFEEIESFTIKEEY